MTGRHILIRVELRDGTISERQVRISFDHLRQVEDALLKNDNVRGFDIYEPMTQTRKSFPEDFDVKKLKEWANAQICRYRP